jgi:hypothetical protein
MWKGQIVAGWPRRRSEAFSQRGFQAKVGEGPARRQDVSVIPEREKQEDRKIEGEGVKLSSS